MFISLFAACEAFHAQHEDWEGYQYIYGTNDELVSFCRSQLQTDDDLQKLLTSGTAEEMDSFMCKFNTEILGKFSVALLKNMLDALHSKEALQELFSKELVQWYRDAGWKFPLFAFEKDT